MKTVASPLRYKKEYFDNVARTWDTKSLIHKKEILQYTIEKTANAAPGKTILDVGCGTGNSFHFLSEFDVIAFDLSLNMIEQAKTKAPPAVQTLMQADAHRIPLRDETIDGIICLAVYPHIIDKSLFLDECYRVLRRDGVLGIIHLAHASEINRIHAESDNVIENDLLPEADEVIRQLEATGFSPIHEEHENFYLIIARK